MSVPESPRKLHQVPNAPELWAGNENNPGYNNYPDNNADKEVLVQARGFMTKGLEDQRHVYICWVNEGAGEENSPNPEASSRIWQIIQLGITSGKYVYYYPLLRVRPDSSISQSQTWSLGFLTRDQRETLIGFAEDIPYRQYSHSEGCRFWMARLLDKMRTAGMVGQDLLDIIRQEVPLPSVTAEFMDN